MTPCGCKFCGECLTLWVEFLVDWNFAAGMRGGGGEEKCPRCRKVVKRVGGVWGDEAEEGVGR